MSEKQNRRGLGRGLSALMSDIGEPVNVAPNRRPDLFVPVESVQPNPEQPRRSFDEKELAELTDSIKEKGVIQPLIVRLIAGKTDKYEIVAGERRWRASQQAQLHEIPVIIREYTDTEMLEVAIIENIQRADLNPIDEAAGYRQLMDRFGHTQEQLASALGKSRSHIANLLRLLGLPEEVLELVVSGALTAGHARALVGQPSAAALARRIVSGNLSVRETERLVKSAKAGPKQTLSKPSARPGKDADTIQLERELAAALGVGVSIDHIAGQEGGKLTLKYKTLDQLDSILRQLNSA
ncbi:MAG: ParB/RepB/Spo0J family partition protein [Rhodobacteraceae bacterium]|nr:ParB/RepB/Spo0J family partition protein [Paracoccaceae bacterium]